MGLAGGRGRKRFLSPSQKYEILDRVAARGVHDARGGRPCGGRSLDDHEAARGRQAGRVGRVGGIAARVRAGGKDPELAAAEAEIARLSEALKEMAVRLMLHEGKDRWD